jgi:SAM-dependent methyltransferase
MSVPQVGENLGALGISEDLRKFVSEMPHEREPILRFLMAKAHQLAPGSRVADVGAGDAPYRELFRHVEYITIDWELSPHEGAGEADVVASAYSIPLAAESFDAMLLTQVLEHVADPLAVLAEQRRLLRPGGSLFLTVPLVWELHELPHDYFRFTAPGLQSLLERAGYAQIEITPRNDCFSTLAQLLRNVRGYMGSAPDGLDQRREQAADALGRLADSIAELGRLDTRMILPLGYAVSAVRPPSLKSDGAVGVLPGTRATTSA